MRAGACSVQQALTAEAASVVKQAVSLARRRGHAQVTPLHVANAMLSSTSGILRTACLQSHSHPLQCKALELCFNVALNRLPSLSNHPSSLSNPHHHHHPSSLSHHHHHHPSLSNALMAAFKRAQAHQRRGSIENQQQPLLAVKVEIEQLIISILDDPSVSRVMREAGFSSTQVKSNVEQAVSLEICNSSSITVSAKPSKEPSLSLPALSLPTVSTATTSTSNYAKSSLDHVKSEDVMSLVDSLMNKRRRNTVIVGECTLSTEGVVRELMGRLEIGDVPDMLKSVQFLSLPVLNFGHMCREEVERKLRELRCIVRGCVGRGVIIYVGDLKWTVELMVGCIEQVVIEIGRLVSESNGENGRLWVMGTSSYQTYMRCKMGHPSLESIWALHPLPIPAGSLGLSLNPDSEMQGELRSKKDGDGLGEVWCLDEIAMEKKQSLSCCADCSSKFEKEARDLVKRVDDDDESCPTSSNLPAWLQQYKDENRRLTSNDPDCHQVRELSKKWNSICNSIHKQQSSRERSMAFSSLSQSSSLSSYGQFYHNWTSPNQHWRNHNQLWISSKESSTDLREENGEPTAAPILSLSTSTNPANPNPNPNSSSSTETMDTDSHKANQLNAETLKTLYDGLEKRVPWQKHIMKEIAITVLECRSRLTKGSTPSSRERKQDMWLLFKGSDSQSKEKIARELATLIFGSESSFLSISPSFPAMERGKRSREEPCFVHLERFSEAITENPHRVIFMPGFEQSDHYFQMGLKRVLERGKVIDSNGQETSICDAIIVLGCESLERESRDFSALTRQRSESSVEMNEKAMDILSLDLNICAEDEDRTCDLELAKFVDGCFVLDVEGGRSEN